MTRPYRRAPVPDKPSRPPPPPKAETDGLRAAMATAMQLRTAAMAAYQLLLLMERQHALRLPFGGHPETMVLLREALGVRE